MKKSFWALALLAGLLLTATLGAGDWPTWRGPALDGTSPDGAVPTRWSASDNVLWKAKAPGKGHSSPIVVGDRVFLTTAEEAPARQLVLAFDRKGGKQLWATPVHEVPFTRKNPKNSHASATLACDGERLYGVFLNRDGLFVTALTLDGKIAWQKKAGPFASEHGYGSSPALYKSLVIVDGDSLKGCFVTALDARSGKVVWRTPRKTTGKHGSYATPVVARVAGRPQLLLMGMGETSAYDPDNGERLWWCSGPSEVTACTPAWNDRLVFATGGYPEKAILAIRADGKGDVTESHVKWRSRSGVAYVPSPLYRDGRLYVVSDSGVATCFDASTGTEAWQKRLTGAFTASLVLAGDRLYATNEAGKTFVLKAGAAAEVVAVNDLGERVLATPAVCGGRVFLRTERHLYCIGGKGE